MYTLHTFPIQQRCAHPGLCPPGQDKWTCLIRYYSYKAASSSSWGGHKAARRSNKMVIISQTEHLLGLEKTLFILNPSLFSLRHDNALVTSPSLDTLRTGSDIFFTNSSEGFCMKWSCQSWAVGFAKTNVYFQEQFFATVKRFLNWTQTIVVSVSSDLMLIWDWGSGEWDVSNRPVCLLMPGFQKLPILVNALSRSGEARHTLSYTVVLCVNPSLKEHMCSDILSHFLISTVI